MTALGTLTGPLGYGALKRLERAELWSVTTREHVDDLGVLGDHLVCRTSVFVNPNKHRWRVWSGGEQDAMVESGAWALVWESEQTEGRRALAELRGAGFEKEIEGVSKATLWFFVFAETARGKELALAEEMAVAVARDKGLLANPHIHRWACGAGDISLKDAVAHLDAGQG